MNNEEKKAIEYWQYIRDTQIYDGYKGQVYAVELLNLVEKQQKEIEELKVINKMNRYRIDERELISKDKIREKIKELSNGTYDAKIILQQLLEEKYK